MRPVDGVLPAALAAAQAGRTLIVPAGNGAEAALARHVQAFTARTLLEVCALLNGTKTLPAATAPPAAAMPFPDLSDVRGQAQARRALEIAAAGHHHLLLIGSPGCGKTLLASRLPGILPEASEAEALETAAIASVSGRGLDPSRWRQRPYRAPHHTASAVSLVGGGCYFSLLSRLTLKKRDSTPYARPVTERDCHEGFRGTSRRRTLVHPVDRSVRTLAGRYQHHIRHAVSGSAPGRD